MPATFLAVKPAPNRETEGFGFEYGWRAEYDFAKHWGIGVEMFGEIEDLANTGTFNQQNQSAKPQHRSHRLLESNEEGGGRW
jgi:hypothetical protein